MYRLLLAAALLCASVTTAYAETCTASWYGSESGPRTASGERFNPGGMTCAHKTRPFGSVVTVTHLGTGRSIHCRINDRGPFILGRCIDLAQGAARALGMIGSGTARVEVR
jgi:rare lipoprotein A